MLLLLQVAEEAAEPSKTPFYILASCLVAFALILSAAAVAALSARAAGDPNAALASAKTDEIAKSPALKAQAMKLGAVVYKANCASCHGADRKGLAEKHAPDLTDAAWLYSGDDVESGGITMFASDIERTVKYGVRSGHEKTRKEAVMPARRPAGVNLLNAEEADDVVDFVLTLSNRHGEAKPDKVERGKALFAGKGNCWDCHADDGIGNGAIGAPDLTLNQWLYGGDRASLARSILGGAAGPDRRARATGFGGIRRRPAGRCGRPAARSRARAPEC